MKNIRAIGLLAVLTASPALAETALPGQPAAGAIMGLTVGQYSMLIHGWTAPPENVMYARISPAKIANPAFGVTAKPPMLQLAVAAGDCIVAMQLPLTDWSIPYPLHLAGKCPPNAWQTITGQPFPAESVMVKANGVAPTMTPLLTAAELDFTAL